MTVLYKINIVNDTLKYFKTNSFFHREVFFEISKGGKANIKINDGYKF